MSDPAFMTLTTIGGGAAVELFGVELEKALRNIADVNTAPKAKRVIRVTVEITPNEERKLGNVMVSVTSKLPSFAPVSVLAYFGRHEGRHIAQEHDSRQLSFDDQPALAGSIQGGKL